MVPLRKTVVIMTALMVWGSLLGSLSAEAATDVKRVRLAYAGWGLGTAVAYVGIDAGIFKKYDLDVEEVFIQDALSGGIQSLIGVDVVLGFGNPVTILQPVVKKGADIVFLGSHVSVEKYSLGVSSGIRTIEDLKGKKVGVSGLGGRSDLVARVILRRAGLDTLKDVEIVSVGMAPQRVVALSKNLIQGTPLSPEIASQADKLGLKVLGVKDVPIVVSLLMTTRSFIKKDQEAARRFIKGYLTAIHYYLTHRNETIAIIKKYMSASDPQALETMYEAFAAQLTRLPVPNAEAVQALIDAASVAERQARNVRPQELFDLRFLEELKASGFIDSLYSEKKSL